MGNNQGEHSEDNNSSGDPEGKDSTKDKYNKEHIVIPYTHGLGESIKNTCKRFGYQTHFKGNRTIKNILVNQRQRSFRQKEWGHLLVPVWGAHV